MQRVRKLLHIDAAEKQGLSGKGIGVGVLDSGVAAHDDLKNKIVMFRDFTTKENSRRIHDESGHGTHVCGIIGGDGSCSKGVYRGIAPGCHMCVGAILNRMGEGNVATLLKGLEWLIFVAPVYNIRIINISVSSLYFSYEEEKKKLYELFQKAYVNNILIVTAAGNAGPAEKSISKLGDSLYVVCVGCHEGRESHLFQKKCQDCSGRGPGDFVYRKPDIVAPGTDIVSCSKINRQYVKKSGTSMATPMISGCAALLLEKNPDMSAEQLKRKLIYATDDLGENYLKQGFGMININKLLGLT